MSQTAGTDHGGASAGSTGGGGRTVLTVVAWAWVVIPFLYGVWQLLLKVPALF